MKKIISLLTAAAMIVSMTACSSKPAETKGDDSAATTQSAADTTEAPAALAGGETRKLTFAHVFATTHPVHIALEEANEELKQKTNGRLELEIFPNATFATYNDAVSAVQMGSLDMACLDSASDWLPKSGVLFGPYVFESYDHWAKFKSSSIYEELKKEISESTGVVQLEMYNFGFRHLTANKEIRTLDDFNNIVLRCVDFPPYSELAKIFNVSITAVPISDVYMALQTGVADAEENPVTQIVTMKFYEVQKYLMLTKHMLAVSSTIMSQSTWDSLSPEDQAIVQEVFKNEADKIDKMVVDDEEALIAECEKNGMQVIRDIDTTPFQERVNLVLESNPDWVELYNAIQELK